jgi:hypothetical protein
MLRRQKDFPRELLVGEETWRVRFVRHIPDYETKTMRTHGLCDPSTQTLFILQGLDPAERQRVFFHEVVHALEDEYDFVIPHDLVEALDTPLARFIVDNYLAMAKAS